MRRVWRTHQAAIMDLAFAVLSACGLLCLQWRFRPFARDGIYFQPWSSEEMMQTLPLKALVQAPLESLWYLHMQPPVFDTLRMLLAHMAGGQADRAMTVEVDRAVYVLWACVFGLMGAVLFHWLRRLTHTLFAFLAALFFLAHPASIFYATMLDTTFLSASLILLLYVLLWKIADGQRVSPLSLAAVFLMLYFTRSLFQWPWILFLGLSVAFIGYPRRAIVHFLLIISLGVGLYSVKQVALFELASTSSFTGYNMCNSVGIAPAFKDFSRQVNPGDVHANAALVLTMQEKQAGSANFNHASYLRVNNELMQVYGAYVREASAVELLSEWKANLGYYLLPSSAYSAHAIVDRLPYRALYDRLFSFPLYPLLILPACVIWLCMPAFRPKALACLGLAAPLVIIGTLTVICERGENMRFKFFVEPIVFVFMAVQYYRLLACIAAEIEPLRASRSLPWRIRRRRQTAKGRIKHP